ncbi:MAG: hypothetical protein J1E64_00405 [Acetatifactor sp.]|nr:hypothetical protein [Acetatifactor sp.]
MENNYVNRLIPVSAAVLTGILTLGGRGDILLKIISVIIVYVGFIVLVKKKKVIFSIKLSPNKGTILAFLLSIYSMSLIRNRYLSDWEYYVNKIPYMPKQLSEHLFTVFLLVAFLSIFLYYMYFLAYVEKYIIQGIIKTLTEKERLYLYVFICCMTLIIVYAHLKTSAFDYARWINANGEIESVPYDAILDCDSPYVINAVYNFVNVFRHPFWSYVSLPGYSLAGIVSLFFTRSDSVSMLFVSFLQMVMLGVSGICVSRLTKSRLTLLIWYTSYPVILYSVVIERHTWMTFWNVIAVYLSYEMSEKNDDWFPIYQAGGANLIGVTITPAIIKFNNIKEFLIKSIKLAFGFLFVIVLTGNLTGLVRVRDEIIDNERFVDHTNILDNIRRFTVAVRSCFGGVKIRIGNHESWYNEAGFSLLGLLCIIVAIIAFLYLRNSRYARVCAYWMGVSIILFPLIGFACYDYSMHMILFSWAYISLIVMLYEALIHRVNKRVLKNIFNIVILILIGWQLVTNIVVINELMQYAVTFNYVQ